MSILSAALRQAGIDALKSGRLDEAIRDLEQAMASDSESPDICSYLGAAYSQKGDFDHARRAFGRAVQLQPQSAKARFNLGMAHKMAGDVEAARFCYTSALEINPEYSHARESLAELPARDLDTINIGALSAPSAKIHVHGAHGESVEYHDDAPAAHELSQAEVAALSTPTSGHLHLVGAQGSTD